MSGNRPELPSKRTTLNPNQVRRRSKLVGRKCSRRKRNITRPRCRSGSNRTLKIRRLIKRNRNWRARWTRRNRLSNESNRDRCRSCLSRCTGHCQHRQREGYDRSDRACADEWSCHRGWKVSRFMPLSFALRKGKIDKFSFIHACECDNPAPLRSVTLIARKRLF